MSKKVEKTLKSIILEGDDNNFGHIAADPYYLQITGAKKDPKIFIDAVANSHLAEDEQLTEEQNNKILELGFEIDPRSGNYTIEKTCTQATLKEVAEFIDGVLDIYGIDPNTAEYEIDID